MSNDKSSIRVVYALYYYKNNLQLFEAISKNEKLCYSSLEIKNEYNWYTIKRNCKYN